MFFGFGFGLRNSTWKSRGRRAVTPRTTVSTLNDDDQGWNLERWWYKPIHVCQKWRHLILSSPSRLDLHLVCTYGIPVEAMLSHSPPLPIIIFYPETTGKTSAADEESALFALQQRERVRRIQVTATTTILCNLFKAMDNEFPMLERLALHSSTESRAGLMLPEKLQAPLLRHLTLSNIAFPIKSLLLRQADGLITLRLWNIPASPEFHPAHLIAQLSGLSRLEILMIHFYTAIHNREVERRPRSAQSKIILPSLKYYLPSGGILARLSAPLLSKLNVEFFNQLTFDLYRLREFVPPTIGEFMFRSAEMHFDKDFVSVIVDPDLERDGTYPLVVQVKCHHSTGRPPAPCRSAMLLSHCSTTPRHVFAGVKTLQLTGGLVGDFFRSLKLDEGELPSELLPELRELVPRGWGHTDDAFASFISARQSAGRRIRMVRN
ncbi:hypothetical protein EDB84DRAFT_1494630 [Lactarius hengduanensis]|nr:hypothetical protein EDB84DRAFT_1494630 [Lactarius hengduanensis]